MCRWIEKEKINTGTLKYFILMYGDIEGEKKYKSVNKRKTVKFDHCSAIQQKRALISADKKRGKKGVTSRSVKYWVNRGFSENYARAKVKEIQTTNNLSKYILKYGQEEGEKKYNERKDKWKHLMSDPIISKSRSLGLWRYIERYGQEEGEKKYNAMRYNRNANNSIGRASKESLVYFAPLLVYLDNNNTQYYIGIEGNKEWFIMDNKRIFFYDLTIPSLNIIVEYHGEAFHPNPSWNKDKWNSWNSLFENFSADEKHLIDTNKKLLAESKGWNYTEIFSSETNVPILNKLKHILH